MDDALKLYSRKRAIASTPFGGDSFSGSGDYTQISNWLTIDTEEAATWQLVDTQ